MKGHSLCPWWSRCSSSCSLNLPRCSDVPSVLRGRSEAWGLLADMVGTVKDVTGMKDHMYVIQANEEKRWNDALQEVREGRALQG